MLGRFGSGVRTLIRSALLVGAMGAGLSTPVRADTGAVRIVLSKGGFVVGFGTGSGMLNFNGRDYPLHVRGVSLGATAGASRAAFVGRAYNMESASDIAGTYRAIAAGGVFGAGAGAVQLKNAKGVVLELKGRKVGFEYSASVSGLRVSLR
jgi:hypothetical protein